MATIPGEAGSPRTPRSGEQAGLEAAAGPTGRRAEQPHAPARAVA